MEDGEHPCGDRVAIWNFTESKSPQPAINSLSAFDQGIGDMTVSGHMSQSHATAREI